MENKNDDMKNIEQNENESSLAQRLRVVRGYFGKSQIDFAKDLGISQSALSAAEIGKVIPSADLIQKIGQMGFELEWLLYGDSKKELSKTVVANTALKIEENRINKLLSKLSYDEMRYCRQWLELYMKSFHKEEESKDEEETEKEEETK